MDTTYNQTYPQDQSKILWPQLASLGGLYASVVIGWIAYYNYQPILLESFNLTQFTLPLFIIQGIILVVTPPIAGRLGDKYRKRTGHRLPIISAGISFTAMIFMAVAFTLFVNPNPGLFTTILIPTAVTAWLVGMSIFTSPAISTVELFAPSEKMPTAMAVITVISGLIYAIEPVIQDVINYLGAPFTFALGGVAVGISGYFLKSNSNEVFDKLSSQAAAEEEKSSAGKSDFPMVIVLGFALGLITSMLFNLFPDRFQVAFDSLLGTDIDGDLVTTVILAFSAILAIPLGRLAENLGLHKSVRLGVIAMFICALAILWFENSALLLIMLVVFALAYTLTSVSSLPLAIKGINLKNKVLGVGFFYAGFELPNGILEATLVYLGKF